MKELVLFFTFFITLFSARPTATIDEHTFFIEIARSPEQQEVGLAKYTTLAENHAMYFSFSHADYYAFWMKGMHFPIDMVFLRNNKIVTIFPRVQVQKEYGKYIYQPTQPADAVLEMDAGISQKYGFKNGDTVYLHL